MPRKKMCCMRWVNLHTIEPADFAPIKISVCIWAPHCSYVRAGQTIARVFDMFVDAGGKSGLRRAGCFVTRSRGDAKESATEKIPPCEIGLVAILHGKGEKVR